MSSNFPNSRPTSGLARPSIATPMSHGRPTPSVASSGRNAPRHVALGDASGPSTPSRTAPGPASSPASLNGAEPRIRRHPSSVIDMSQVKAICERHKNLLPDYNEYSTWLLKQRSTLSEAIRYFDSELGVDRPVPAHSEKAARRETPIFRHPDQPSDDENDSDSDGPRCRKVKKKPGSSNLRAAKPGTVQNPVSISSSPVSSPVSSPPVLDSDNADSDTIVVRPESMEVDEEPTRVARRQNPVRSNRAKAPQPKARRSNERLDSLRSRDSAVSLNSSSSRRRLTDVSSSNAPSRGQSVLCPNSASAPKKSSGNLKTSVDKPGAKPWTQTRQDKADAKAFLPQAKPPSAFVKERGEAARTAQESKRNLDKVDGELSNEDSDVLMEDRAQTPPRRTASGKHQLSPGQSSGDSVSEVKPRKKKKAKGGTAVASTAQMAKEVEASNPRADARAPARPVARSGQQALSPEPPRSKTRLSKPTQAPPSKPTPRPPPATFVTQTESLPALPKSREYPKALPQSLSLPNSLTNAATMSRPVAPEHHDCRIQGCDSYFDDIDVLRGHVESVHEVYDAPWCQRQPRATPPPTPVLTKSQLHKSADAESAKLPKAVSSKPASPKQSEKDRKMEESRELLQRLNAAPAYRSLRAEQQQRARSGSKAPEKSVEHRTLGPKGVQKRTVPDAEKIALPNDEQTAAQNARRMSVAQNREASVLNEAQKKPVPDRPGSFNLSKYGW